MPGRLIPIISGEYYHIFNIGISHQQTYTTKRDYCRFINAARYYLFKETPIKYANLSILSLEDREHLWEQLYGKCPNQASLLAYCLMPNHFHMVLRQEEDNGIAKFIGNLCNSYTRYFNIRHNRSGPLFQGKFKAVHIQTDEQLLHVVRYVHLNPFTGYVIKSIEDCFSYPYSSLPVYKNENHIKDTLVKKEAILKYFNTIEAFDQFTIDHAEYQKTLGHIKHLSLD